MAAATASAASVSTIGWRRRGIVLLGAAARRTCARAQLCGGTAWLHAHQRRGNSTNARSSNSSGSIKTGRPGVAGGLLGGGYVNLAEHYILEDGAVLGSGSFGVVYAATARSSGAAECAAGGGGGGGGGGEAKLQRRVAIKALDKRSRSFDREVIRNEVRVLRAVAELPGGVGDSVGDLLDVLEDRGYVYLVSTLYGGGELFDRILERRMYNEADAACIMAQLLRVLASFHEHGIMHRDIKPENILLRREQSFRGSQAEELEIVSAPSHRLPQRSERRRDLNGQKAKRAGRGGADQRGGDGRCWWTSA
eukprot:COSAG01_NODE_9035_length_2574_cov_4.997576_2_plen_308_part_00